MDDRQAPVENTAPADPAPARAARASTGAARGAPAHSAAIAFALAQVGDLAASRFADRLTELGLTPAHAGLLRAVAGGEGRSQQALAGQLGLLPSKLVALVDDLEKRGALERRRNPHDRRHHALHLTDEGYTVLGDLGRLATAHGEDLLAPLDDAERAALAQLLSRLADHHDLTPGVHPGYRRLGAPEPGARRPAPQPSGG